LFVYNLETNTARLLIAPPDGGATDDNISLEEALRRERLRQREFGITSYAWSGNGRALLIPLRGSLYVKDMPDGELRLLVEGGKSPILDPQFSPDSQWVAYAQDAEIYVVPVTGGEPRQITFDARGTGKMHGLAEYIAQEEMDRRRGYWWSPDSRFIAFTEVDETHIPVYPIVHQGKDATGPAIVEKHRYPFVGQANAIVRLAVTSIAGGEPVWLDLGEDNDIYLARVNWLPDGRITAQILNREQSQLDLLRFDPQTGAGTRLLRETSDVWINLHKMFRPLKDGRFLWASERTGFMHLYLYDGDGELVRPLTEGDWLVDEIVGLDEKAGMVYFTATHPDPKERHLYAVSLEGGEIRPLTPEPGMHTTVINRQKTQFLDTWHNVNRPPTITLRSLKDRAILQTIFAADDPRVAELALPAPELVTLENRDGVTLYGAVYRPPVRFGDGPHPTIVSVYGGPHAQRVTNSWGLTVDMRAQYLAQQGFLVFKLDNRGSARRGLAFESGIKHRMGSIEVQDQADGVRWLAAQGWADSQRVGIYGWSYGGYMALMCLAQAGEVFSTAVAGALVTSWDGYDTCYTERYMGLPQTNPDGYERSSVMAHVDKMAGNLLLVHGLIDENVHFRHTARLVNALIAANKEYDLLLFPDSRHMPRKSADRLYMEKHIGNFFGKWLVD
ncbi:MAG TPA: S9 family peptidase, partial [Anaerolineae bacterium]|nr:S9 family peptidase [Anaerolineae bacterium]